MRPLVRRLEITILSFTMPLPICSVSKIMEAGRYFSLDNFNILSLWRNWYCAMVACLFHSLPKQIFTLDKIFYFYMHRYNQHKMKVSCSGFKSGGLEKCFTDVLQYEHLFSWIISLDKLFGLWTDFFPWGTLTSNPLTTGELYLIFTNLIKPSQIFHICSEAAFSFIEQNRIKNYFIIIFHRKVVEWNKGVASLSTIVVWKSGFLGLLWLMTIVCLICPYSKFMIFVHFVLVL